MGRALAGRTAGDRALQDTDPVVRPEDPAVFNGTVVVFWNNVSAGYENIGGGESPELFDGGYA